jgi:hypothetical protein
MRQITAARRKNAATVVAFDVARQVVWMWEFCIVNLLHRLMGEQLARP